MPLPHVVRQVLTALLLGLIATRPGLAAERVVWTGGWELHAGETTLASANDRTTAVAGWRAISVPHDWSIEGTPEEHAASTGHGGFFPTGIGWYRRAFVAPEAWRERTVALEFEAAYMNAEVWLNGVPVAHQPYGFIPFRADLTPHLRFGAENVVVVRVDNSAQPNARFYTGSGLIRPVTLEVASRTRIAPDGVFVRTEKLSDHQATLRIDTELTVADVPQSGALSVSHRIISPDGRTVLESRLRAADAASAHITLPEPQLWTLRAPKLYRVVTTLWERDQAIDEVVTDIGVRTVRVSAERGFELNGEPLELNGGNVHHDHGPLGAAAFAPAEDRKVELLKAAGFNAVRTAHNPPSRAFLAACDRLGLLVIDEAFDGWAKAKVKHDYSTLFAAWWRRDVEAWVRAHRNHPSVVMWSVGNEMYERANAEGLRIARELTARVRELDSSRPVTAGVNGLGKTGQWEQLDPLFATFDVAGYNYELANHVADHARVPGRVIVAAESYQNEVFTNWQIATQHRHVIGDFVWSGIDYLGEAGIGRVFPPGETARKHWEGSLWPWHGAYCGDIDLTGWRKPISHYRAIVWDGGEKLYASVIAPAPGGGEWNLTPWSLPPALPSWTWDVPPGTPLQLEVASRYERVRVLLNGRTVAEAATGEAEEFRARVTVPYEPGELVVVGLAGDAERERVALRTAGVATQLRITTDRSKLSADGEDLVFLTVEALDAAGNWCPLATPEVTVAIEGPATLAGYGTGDVSRPTNYQAPQRPLFQGRALAVVRATHDTGPVTVRFRAPGLPVAEVSLEAAIFTR